jgi:DNA-directed RNA polymerase delta subunit
VAQDHKKKVAQRTLNECYLILKSSRKPRSFRELLAAGWEKVEPEVALTGTILANLYTSLNLDARFEPLGKGEWGLTEWRSRPARSSVPATSLMGRSYADERLRQPSRLASPTLSELESDSSATVEETFLSLDDSDEEPWDEDDDSDSQE